MADIAPSEGNINDEDSAPDIAYAGLGPVEGPRDHQKLDIKIENSAVRGLDSEFYYRRTNELASKRYPRRRLQFQRNSCARQHCQQSYEEEEEETLDNEDTSVTPTNTRTSKRSRTIRKCQKQTKELIKSRKPGRQGLKENKRQWIRFSPEQLVILNKSYREFYRFPDKFERFKLSSILGVQLSRIESWLSQRRTKENKQRGGGIAAYKKDAKSSSALSPSDEKILLDFFRNTSSLPIPQEILQLSKITSSSILEIADWFERKRRQLPETVSGRLTPPPAFSPPALSPPETKKDDPERDGDEGKRPVADVHKIYLLNPRNGVVRNFENSPFLGFNSLDKKLEKVDRHCGSQKNITVKTETWVQDTMWQLGRLPPSKLEDIWPEIENCLTRLMDMAMEDAKTRQILEEDSNSLKSLLMCFNFTLSRQKIVIGIHNSNLLKEHSDEKWDMDEDSDEEYPKTLQREYSSIDDNNFIFNVLNPWAVVLIYAKLSQQTVAKSLRDLEINDGGLSQRRWTVPKELDDTIALDNSI